MYQARQRPLQHWTAQHGCFPAVSATLSKRLREFTAFSLIAASMAAHAGPWTKMPDFPSTGMRELISFSIGNNGYYGITTTQEFWKFDTTSETWSQLSNMPGLAFQSPNFVIGTQAFVISGNQVWAYAPGADSWTQMQDAPDGSWRAGLAVSIDGTGYIGGGFFNGSDFYAYTPGTDSWSKKVNLPLSSVVSGLGFSTGGSGYFEGTNVNNTFKYNPLLNEWASLSDVNATYGKAFIADEVPYIYNTYGSVFAYDVAANTWNQTSTSPGTPVCYAGGFSVDYKVFVGVGGVFENNTCTLTINNEFWEYDTRVVFSDDFE